MKLILLVLLAVSAVLAKQVCTPRTKFNDYCNKCTCSDDGLSFGCTRMMCDKTIWSPDGTMKDSQENDRSKRSVEKVCKPRSHFKNYCNTCACSEDGLSFICTRMMCDENIWNKDGTLIVIPSYHNLSKSDKQVCTPRSQFKNYCNTCACSDDGSSFSCTRMMCDESIWNADGTKKDIPESDKFLKSTKQVCTPHSKFNDYCNTCACSDDGLSFACTEMMCDKNIWYPDGTRKVIPENENIIPSIQKACEPRSQFKDYCNTCTCSDDGLSHSCTRMMCNKKIWNQDGTLKPFLTSEKLRKSLFML